MTIKEKFVKLRKFLTRDIWHIEIDKSVSGIRQLFLKELQMAVLVIKSTQKHFLFGRASALAFTTMISLIPVLAILFMFFKAFGGELVETQIKPLIYEYLTAGIGDNITEYIDSFLTSATVDTLGTIGVVFLLAAVYSILSSIEISFNAIWQVNKNRTPIEMLKTYLTIVFISPILLVLSIWVAAKLERIMIIGDSFFGGFSNFMLVHLAPFVLITILFMCLIVIMPNTSVRLKNAFVGAVFGAVAYTVLKEIFLYYTKMAVSYNVIYGSLAILPFFMLWIYFSWVIVLLSVEISYVRQNVHNLKHLETGSESNRLDKLKIAFMIVLSITKNFMSGKEQLSRMEISEELDISLKDISETLKDLEKSNIIIEIAKKPDAYTLNVPPEKLTLGKVTDAVDKMYVPHKSFKSEKLHRELSLIFKDRSLTPEKDELIVSLMEK